MKTWSMSRQHLGEGDGEFVEFVRRALDNEFVVTERNTAHTVS
jgi:hypothetical protein